MGLASFSLSSCLDVVPEETSEWKPEIAPQATVVNSTGNKYCVPFPLSTENPPNAGKLASKAVSYTHLDVYKRQHL